jgi:tRNA threonylcarbamoyl adenosine modification protein (Sua5/YciO/YrdC/YwlC family)
MRVRVEAQRPNPRHVRPAIEALGRGDVIVYPTDTGYAFGCALSSHRGIDELRRLKGIDARHKKPLTMLVASLSDIGRYGVMSNEAFRHVRRLLPGPYTIILRASSEVPRSMRNREHEVGMRMPDHALCTLLVADLGEPLLTGSVTPAEAEPGLEEPESIEARFAREVSVVLDAGPAWPDPSTVLRFTDHAIEVLRQGQGPLPDWAA